MLNEQKRHLERMAPCRNLLRQMTGVVGMFALCTWGQVAPVFFSGVFGPPPPNFPTDITEHPTAVSASIPLAPTLNYAAFFDALTYDNGS